MKNWREHLFMVIAILVCLIGPGILGDYLIKSVDCKYADLVSVTMQYCCQDIVLGQDSSVVITILICTTILLLAVMLFAWGITNVILEVALKHEELLTRKELLEKKDAKSSDKHEERTDD